MGFIVCLTLLPTLAAEHVQLLDYRLNEQIFQVPAGKGGHARLQTTVFRPDGPGPFPLIIINHGKDAGAPAQQARDRFIYMATAFVKRGYAVMVPMRRGFAGSTGRYVEYGCNMTANGLGQASDVRDTLDFARGLPFIDSERIVVAGQSYGGLATIAMGTQDAPGVRGLINFAGGLRDNTNRCDWRAALVRAMAHYGSANRLPSLWMYGENDSLFSPELASRMHQAYVRAGGDARLVEYGAFRRDAHGLIGSRDGEKIWWADTARFLTRIGMPTAELYAVAPAPSMPKSDFAPLDDVDAVPFLHAAGKLAYREYLGKLSPRAFALSANGAWCWAEDGEDPDVRALATCEAKGGQRCRLYSVDNNVVWRDDRPVDTRMATLAAAVAGAKGAAGNASTSAAVGGSASDGK
ncbi:dienelactone hydrolase family protein [Massilia sp. DWR3-1-1]|uniref:dienelactone hydrolase family protein n=1 Tax=Massilia sp. DWR3-1-1 TaxID=2804559 RepID=UPI003CF4D737